MGPECHPLGGLFFASSLALLMLVAPVCVRPAWDPPARLAPLLVGDEAGVPHPYFLPAPPLPAPPGCSCLRPTPGYPASSIQGCGTCPCSLPHHCQPSVTAPLPQVTCLACVVTPSRSPGRNHTVPCLAVCTGPPLWVGCFLVVGAASRGLRLPVVQPRLATPAHCSPRHTTACSIRDRASCLGLVSWDIFPFEPSVLVPLGSSCRVTA